MIKLSAEEVKALRGTEVTYRYTNTHGPEPVVTDVDAYVAQADIKKGITIMGILPEGMDDLLSDIHGNEKDVILCCCNSHGDVDETYEEIINHYIDQIQRKVFSPRLVAGSANLTGSCAFGG